LGAAAREMKAGRIQRSTHGIKARRAWARRSVRGKRARAGIEQACPLAQSVIGCLVQLMYSVYIYIYIHTSPEVMDPLVHHLDPMVEPTGKSANRPSHTNSVGFSFIGPIIWVDHIGHRPDGRQELGQQRQRVDHGHHGAVQRGGEEERVQHRDGNGYP
jgi:hypothetical protein